MQYEKSKNILYFYAVSSAALFLLGLSVIIGWHNNNSTLIQIRSDFPSMHYSTAIGFLVISLGFLSILFTKNDLIPAFFGILTLLIGLLKLFGHLSGIDIVIASLLIDNYLEILTQHRAVLALSTAFCFILSGTALAAVTITKRKTAILSYMVAGLGMLVLALGSITFFNYLTGMKEIYSWESFADMAVHTAFGFVLSGLCIVTLILHKYRIDEEIKFYTVSAIILIIGFNIDLLTPLSIAAGLFYMLFIFCSIWIRNIKAVFIFAAISSAMIILGYVAVYKIVVESPITVSNRILTVGIIWLIAYMLYIIRKRTLISINNENRLKAVLDNVVDGIINIDGMGYINAFNLAAEKIFGYKAEEVMGKNVKMLMPDPYKKEHDGYLRNYHDTQEAKIIGIGREVKAQRKDGTIFPIELGVSEIRIGDKKMFVGITRDITERKKSENSINRYTDMLEKSNEDLDEFAYIASHDLKEPLRGISNYSMFLLEDYGDKLDKAGKDKLNTLPKLCTRMEKLIDDLLYFSRLGRAGVAFQETDLDSIASDIKREIKEISGNEGLNIRITTSLPRTNCDAVRIKEVFRNLVTNAIKYNDNDEKQIEIGAIEKERPVVFYVKDNGIGIKEEHKKDIFQIFHRLHGKNKYGGGTGSGLTFVKKIVEGHGGKIWLESHFGVGTTFYFTLEEEAL